VAITIIQITDREFSLRIIKKISGDPKDLTGLTTTDLSLVLPGGDANLTITLTPNLNGSKLEITDALLGKIKVTLSDIDTALLKVGDAQGIELTILEGAGPDFEKSIVQFPNAINVKKSLFET